jgi:excisionase family DNA binding protein
MERRWLKAKEAAWYLGINPKTLYDLLAKGSIAHSRCAGIGIRIDKKRLDEMLENKEIPAVREQLKI